MNIFNKVTLKTLAKNRTRTIVTIVGIMLSTSLITAVTTFTSSMQNCLLQNAIAQSGDWYGAIHSVEKKEVDKLNANDKISQVTSTQNIGYSILKDSTNKNKPYLYVIGIDNAFEKSVAVHITSGRLPQNSSEIMLPNHLFENGGIKNKLEDILELEIGQRVLDGKNLDQDNGTYNTKDGTSNNEEFIVKEERTYTVVGFYERPTFEQYSAPGYTAITVMDKTVTDSYLYNSYFKLKNPKDTSEFLSQYKLKNINTEYNSRVLVFLGVTQSSAYNIAIGSILLIVILLIMGGSVLLIYNAFAISVSERTKQFGLLSSIGATKRQISRSVLFEALFVSIIGIPLGIILGIVGIGITLLLIKDRLALMVTGMFAGSVPLTLKVSFWAIIAAVVTAIVTVLISAWIPSKRAMKVTAIQAIQQSNDIKMNSKKLKTHKWIYKVFGFEGALAQKNFRRNKKKYRATVISLFMSVVLFITASSLCMYVLEASSGTLSTNGYEICYYNVQSEIKGNDLSIEQFTKKISELDGVKNVSSVKQIYGELSVSNEIFSDEYMRQYKSVNKDGVLNTVSVDINCIDDISFEKYLKDNNLSKDKYMNPEKSVLIASSNMKIKDSETGKTSNISMLKQDKVKIIAKLSKFDDQGKNISYEDIELNIGLSKDKLVMGVYSNNGNTISVMIPQCMIGTVYKSDLFNNPPAIYVATNTHDSVAEKIKTILKDNNLPVNRLYDLAKEDEYSKNMIFIIQVFAYGFITLISLISVANVFNTISTNILLRRREFAMLKSVGMTKRGFNKMMNFECILYGVKSLLLGLPVSIAITYYIYKSINSGYEMPFTLPWSAIGIAIFSVFAVVFATMIYSMRKIKKDNPIDALKNENL
ncbi:ABC transporter permease [[Clostridium] fimetarium]|uniref:Putative ABC transport system permease protein n=1 Tax=[Clostridium] fimetarium TaxID=99656 RepID=A0A1I0QZF1_9FIRM|nr:ABC transporter permease [[Clostridium] fimetarium]SEW33064.1 putative ABC transport system permease protein [[Clostridium] fimetarium]